MHQMMLGERLVRPHGRRWAGVCARAAGAKSAKVTDIAKATNAIRSHANRASIRVIS